MPTYPLETLSFKVDDNGISAPPYSDILESLKASMRNIYGEDVYLEPDGQDGQVIAIYARAVSDSNDRAIATYNSMSPQTASGAALSSRVKMNGIERNVPSRSQVSVVVTGTVGTTLTNCKVKDTENDLTWALPASVVIPPTGFVLVTATCETEGAIEADAHTVTLIATPVAGWQSADNPTAASAGAPVESDPVLRIRQTKSVAGPSQTVMDGIVASVAELPGVTDVVGYENDTGATDANGVPAHTISIVVRGGDDEEVAQTINLKKGPGPGTHGNTSVVIVGTSGFPKTIRYYRPEPVELLAEVDIKALTGYSSSIGQEIKDALIAYVQANPTGSPLYVVNLYLPCQLYGDEERGAKKFKLLSVKISKKPAAPGTTDLTFLMYQDATLDQADITLTVTP